jgi:hypothetical protein
MAAAAGVVAAAVFTLPFGRFFATPTDISAWRITLGDVPYRDFWTMYAPGSLVVLSWLFELFGREMIVSRVAGVVTSAAAVGLYYTLAARVGGRRPAALAAVVVIAAYFHAGYYRNFGSYPTALPLLLGAVLALTPAPGRASPGSEPPLESGRAVVAGALVGAAVVCKHDVGGYALAALVGAVLVAAGGRLADRVRSAAIVVGAAAVVVTPVIAWLAAAGAAAAAFDALVRFPLTDFPHVRPEALPLLPTFSGDGGDRLRSATRWLLGHGPGVAILLGIAAVTRTAGRPGLPLAWWWAVLAFPLFWSAAHVQFNTHAITLPLLGALAGVAAWRRGDAAPMRGTASWHARTSLAVSAVTAAWIAVVLVEPGYRVAVRWAARPQAIGVPHLAGISEPAEERAWLRGLAEAIRAAAPAEAPLLLVGARNDTLIFAEPVPYWLSDRRPASRHHELHPAITDTDAGQREILAAVTGGPRPVVVREHRFLQATIDDARRVFQSAGVPVGATALDAWITAEYRPGPMYGRYEIMVPRSVP